MTLNTSTAFPNFRTYGSCGGIDLIVPMVDDRGAVEIINELHDALFQFVFRADADVTEHGAGGFGEEPLDEIEPGAESVRSGSKASMASTGREWLHGMKLGHSQSGRPSRSRAENEPSCIRGKGSR